MLEDLDRKHTVKTRRLKRKAPRGSPDPLEVVSGGLTEHAGRQVESDDPGSALQEHPREPALAAAQIEYESALERRQLPFCAHEPGVVRGHLASEPTMQRV